MITRLPSPPMRVFLRTRERGSPRRRFGRDARAHERSRGVMLEPGSAAATALAPSTPMPLRLRSRERRSPRRLRFEGTARAHMRLRWVMLEPGSTAASALAPSSPMLLPLRRERESASEHGTRDAETESAHALEN